MAEVADLINFITSQQARQDTLELQKQQMALNRIQFDFKRDEASLEREHEKSKMYIEHNLNELSTLSKRKTALQDEEMRLGILENKLDSVSDIQTTSGGKSVFRTSSEGLEADIQTNEQEILKISGNIKNYYAGFNLAKDMDADASGYVDGDELADYFETSGLSPEYLKNRAFTTGVKSYTLSPEQILKLKEQKKILDLKDLAIEKAGIENQFLPSALQDDATLRREAIKKAELEGTYYEDELFDARRMREGQIKKLEMEGNYLEQSLIDQQTLTKQAIDTGNLNYMTLGEQYEQAKKATAMADQQIGLNNLQIAQQEEVFADTQYKVDKEKRQDHIASLEQLKVNNIQAQSGIGVGILSNISLQLETDGDIAIYTPMFSVLAGTVEDDYIEKINKASEDGGPLQYIRSEVLELYAAYGAGRAEEMLPDYSIVLDKVKDIIGYKELYNKFGKEYDMQLEQLATKMNRNKYSYEVMLAVAEYADPNVYPNNSIMRAIQWANTGIYKNERETKLLESAVIAKNQSKQIDSNLERARGLDISYTAEQTAGTYQGVPLSPIQMRFGTTAEPAITPVTQDTLYNIFSTEDKAGNLK